MVLKTLAELRIVLINLEYALTQIKRKHEDPWEVQTLG